MALLNSQPVPGLLRGRILATDTGNGGYPLPRYKYLSPLQLSIELLATDRSKLFVLYLIVYLHVWLFIIKWLSGLSMLVGVWGLELWIRIGDLM